GEHLGALNHRYMQPPSFDNFRVIDRNCGTRNHNVRAGNVGGGVSLKNGRAQSTESLCDRRSFQVGAGNLVAEIQQHLGNPAHADATDTHEMNALNLGEHKNLVAKTLMIDHTTAETQRMPGERGLPLCFPYDLCG